MEGVISMTLGYVLKCNYDLPYNASVFTDPYVRYERSVDDDSLVIPEEQSRVEEQKAKGTVLSGTRFSENSSSPRTVAKDEKGHRRTVGAVAQGSLRYIGNALFFGEKQTEKEEWKQERKKIYIRAWVDSSGIRGLREVQENESFWESVGINLRDKRLANWIFSVKFVFLFTNLDGLGLGIVDTRLWDIFYDSL